MCVCIRGWKGDCSHSSPHFHLTLPHFALVIFPRLPHPARRPSNPNRVDARLSPPAYLHECLCRTCCRTGMVQHPLDPRCCSTSQPAPGAWTASGERYEIQDLSRQLMPVRRATPKCIRLWVPLAPPLPQPHSCPIMRAPSTHQHPLMRGSMSTSLL